MADLLPSVGIRCTPARGRTAKARRRLDDEHAQRSEHAKRKSRQSGARGADPLGNTQAGFPTSTGEPDSREKRWRKREFLREITQNLRVKSCGSPRQKLVELKQSGAGGGAGYGGLETCGSVWLCPVCSAKISVKRREELNHVVHHALKHDVVVSMLTLTMRHDASQDLEYLWDSLTKAWNSLTSGRSWQGFKTQLGLVGWVRATEVTEGENGWHVHVHVIVLTRENPETAWLVLQPAKGNRKVMPRAQYIQAADWVGQRWGKALAKRGVGFLQDRGGLHWEVAASPEAAAAYVVKMQKVAEETADSISSEATLGSMKKGRRGNRTPFQILEDIEKNGDVDDLDLWLEYERVSKGRRALTWSKGLREWAGLGVEQTDEEIAAEDTGGEVVALIPRPSWERLRKDGAAARLLRVLENEGRDAALTWLKANRIFFLPPDPPPLE